MFTVYFDSKSNSEATWNRSKRRNPFGFCTVWPLKIVVANVVVRRRRRVLYGGVCVFRGVAVAARVATVPANAQPTDVASSTR